MIFLLLLVWIFPLWGEGSAVTYSFSGGRLGDNLAAYFHARWIAYKYHLPLLYVPFPLSEQFQLHDMDPPLSLPFANTVQVTREEEIVPTACSTLFVIPYFSESPFEFGATTHPLFRVDWEDPEFHAEVVQCLTPKNPVSTLRLPHNKITVGVHVRRGGGTDPDWLFSALPLKFPPDSYYIEQIQHIASLFKNKRLYVFLLTDDTNPKAMKRRYEKLLDNPLIEIACREENNGPCHNILEDFFTIPKFDCFILCQSHFSLIAAKLAQFTVSILPMHSMVKEDQIIIDEVKVTPPSF